MLRDKGVGSQHTECSGVSIRQTNILRTARDRMATNSCVSEKPVLRGKKIEPILADEQNIEQINNQHAAYMYS